MLLIGHSSVQTSAVFAPKAANRLLEPARTASSIGHGDRAFDGTCRHRDHESPARSYRES